MFPQLSVPTALYSHKLWEHRVDKLWGRAYAARLLYSIPTRPDITVMVDWTLKSHYLSIVFPQLWGHSAVGTTELTSYGVFLYSCMFLQFYVPTAQHFHVGT